MNHTHFMTSSTPYSDPCDRHPGPSLSAHPTTSPQARDGPYNGTRFRSIHSRETVGRLTSRAYSRMGRILICSEVFVEGGWKVVTMLLIWMLQMGLLTFLLENSVCSGCSVIEKEKKYMR